MTEERAVLSGGCFRGAQDLIRRYDGVVDRAGYTGGSGSHAIHRNHGTHAETWRKSSVLTAGRQALIGINV